MGLCHQQVYFSLVLTLWSQNAAATGSDWYKYGAPCLMLILCVPDIAEIMMVREFES